MTIHVVSPEGGPIEINDGTVMRRYMEIPKLFGLLFSGKDSPRTHRLFFSSIGHLRHSDPFECIIFPHGRYSGSSDAELRKRVCQLRRFSREDKKFLSAHHRLALEKFVWRWESEAFARQIVCNCWHEGKEESAAMWKLYANQHGVAVETTIGQLKASLLGEYPDAGNAKPDVPFQHDNTIAPIKYIGGEECDLPAFYRENPWMLKREGFKHEREVRIFHELDRIRLWNGGVNLGIDASKLIQRIIISPFLLKDESKLPYALAWAIQQITKKINPSIQVEPSRYLAACVDNDEISKAIRFEHLKGVF